MIEVVDRAKVRIRLHELDEGVMDYVLSKATIWADELLCKRHQLIVTPNEFNLSMYSSRCYCGCNIHVALAELSVG